MPQPAFLAAPNLRLDEAPADVLMAEIGPWHDYNFPDWRSKPYCLLLGIVEEWGEYADAETKDDRLDAAGDVCVYLAAYATTCGFHPSDVARWFSPDGELPNSTRVLVVLGELCHARLKADQDIRGTVAKHMAKTFTLLEELLSLLASVLHCDYADEDLHGAIRRAWGEVRSRDWPQRRAQAKLTQIFLTEAELTPSPVASSNLKAIAWHAYDDQPGQGVVEITFAGDARYRYAHVPVDVFNSMKASSALAAGGYAKASVGQDFHKMLRGWPRPHTAKLTSEGLWEALEGP
jgi:NTP pyrophosphatase (non-canonical NTP hydrolase)